MPVAMAEPNCPGGVHVVHRNNQIFCGQCDYCLASVFPQRCPECGVVTALPTATMLELHRRIAPVFYAINVGACIGALAIAMGRDVYKYSFVPVSPYLFTILNLCANSMLCVIAIWLCNVRNLSHASWMQAFAAIITLVAIACI